MKIAFLGLGNMGSGIASRILAAGHPMMVWNRTPAKAEPLVRMGAELAKAPEAAVAECEIVVTSLMDDASIRNMFDIFRRGLRRASSWRDPSRCDDNFAWMRGVAGEHA